jgi:DNA-binding LacI/PurR family transcriptional regulator
VHRYAVASDFTAGTDVGRFLLARGHQAVCCWSEGNDRLWAHERVAGIRHAFAEAGLADCVHSFSAMNTEHAEQTRSAEAVLALLRDSLRRAYRTLGIPYRMTTLRASALDAFAAGLRRDLIYRRLAPAMKKALRARQATAWVGTNDELAVECLRYLQDRGVRTPQDVSVIGFDDAFEATSRHMSSYNFNATAAFNRMVDFLLWPNSPIAGAETGRTVFVEGFVQERATTAVAGR